MYLYTKMFGWWVVWGFCTLSILVILTIHGRSILDLLWLVCRCQWRSLALAAQHDWIAKPTLKRYVYNCSYIPDSIAFQENLVLSELTKVCQKHCWNKGMEAARTWLKQNCSSLAQVFYTKISWSKVEPGWLIFAHVHLALIKHT